jgi:hypothetical protein
MFSTRFHTNSNEHFKDKANFIWQVADDTNLLITIV